MGRLRIRQRTDSSSQMGCTGHSELKGGPSKDMSASTYLDVNMSLFGKKVFAGIIKLRDLGIEIMLDGPG